jgi:hypothetical protein
MTGIAKQVAISMGLSGIDFARYMLLAACWLALSAPISLAQEAANITPLDSQESTIGDQETSHSDVGYQLTPGRRGSLVGGAVGLVSVVLAGLSLAWPMGSGNSGSTRRFAAVVAVAAGLAGLFLGTRHLAQATGGFGSGSGRLGAIVAIILSIGGMAAAGLTLIRSRSTR